MENITEFDAERLAVTEALEEAETGGLENINSYIAGLDRVAKTTPEYINKLKNTSLNLKKLLEDSVSIYGYLRDTFKIQTVTEARACIADRKVDSKIIELWIEEGMFGIDMHLSNAVDEGYPELSYELKKKREEITGKKE